MLSTRVGVGLSSAADAYTCGREAARAAQAQLANPADVTLALLFASHPSVGDLLAGANDALGEVPLIGVTSAGQYSHEGYVEDGAGVLLIQGSTLQVRTSYFERRMFNRRRLLGDLKGVTPEGLGSSHRHRALILFPDDQSMNLDRVVDRAMSETGMLYDIVGGPGPTIQRPPRPPGVFFGRQIVRGGLSSAELLSALPLGIALDNGWTPLRGPYRVTHADGQRIIKIDGRPALEVYEDFLMELGLSTDSDELDQQTAQFPIGVCEGSVCKVSLVMGFDRGGAMRVTSPPPAGRLIHILSTQPDAMVTAAQRAVDQARRRTPSAAGALFIDCMSTGMLLSDTYPRQRQAVQERLGSMPFLGFQELRGAGAASGTVCRSLRVFRRHLYLSGLTDDDECARFLCDFGGYVLCPHSRTDDYLGNGCARAYRQSTLDLRAALGR